MSDTPAAPESFLRRHPRLAVFGGIVAVLLLIAGVFALKIRAKAAERWAAFEQRHAESLKRLQADEGRRTSLAGPAQAGNAWDLYKPALDVIEKDQKALSKEDKEALEDAFKAAPKAGTKDAAARILASRLTLLEPLRKGAHAERAFYPIEWSKGASAEIPKLLAAQHAGRLVALSARARRESGDVAGALDELAVGLQFGLDQGRPPVIISAMIGNAVVRIQLDEVKAILEDPATAPALVERIAAMLPEVERQLQGVPAMIETDYVLWTGETLRQMVEGRGDIEQETGIKASLASWRNGFSVRLMAAEVQDHCYAMVEKARKAEPLDYLSAIHVHEAMTQAETGSGNPFEAMAIPSYSGIERSSRETKARIRMLLAATRLRQGKPSTGPDWPADPFTLKPLGCKVDGGTTRISCAWKDGIENPTGSWTPKNDDEDLVLELKR